MFVHCSCSIFKEVYKNTTGHRIEAHPFLVLHLWFSRLGDTGQCCDQPKDQNATSTCTSRTILTFISWECLHIQTTPLHNMCGALYWNLLAYLLQGDGTFYASLKVPLLKILGSCSRYPWRAMHGTRHPVAWYYRTSFSFFTWLKNMGP